MDYTYHGGAPRPNTGPNKPPERRIVQRRRSPAAEIELRRVPPPPRAPFDSGRRICFLRLRLDLEPFCSQPPDRDPMDQIRAYRFSQALLHKSPWVFRNKPAIQLYAKVFPFQPKTLHEAP